MMALVLLAATLNTLHGVANGGSNVFARHSGQPAALLALIMVFNGSFSLGLHAVLFRLSFRFSAAALPLLACGAFLAGRNMCRTLLEAPGTDGLLGSLHSLLSLVHAAPVTPLPDMVLLHHTAAPLQQCQVATGSPW
ncbi:hypothetical protein ABPG75_010155 [Micractinium tetrahymenae]